MPGPIDAAVCQQIITESHGNALALIELGRVSKVSDFAGGFGVPAGNGVAGKVAQAYEERLDGLPLQTRLLVPCHRQRGCADQPCHGVSAQDVGKPNPLMMRSALNAIEAHSEHTAMVGDRIDTDIVAGLEAGLHTILVLTGVSSREAAERYPYRPARIADSVADRVDDLAPQPASRLGTTPGAAIRPS